MTIQQFAEVYSLQTHKDACRDLIVGKPQHHVFDGYTTGLGAYFNCSTARQWNTIRRKLITAGAILRQNGDVDGVVQFDPANTSLTKLVLKLTGARKKRVLTATQREALTTRLANARAAKR